MKRTVSMNNNHASKDVLRKGHFIDVKETRAFYHFPLPCPHARHSIDEIMFAFLTVQRFISPYVNIFGIDFTIL